MHTGAEIEVRGVFTERVGLEVEKSRHHGSMDVALLQLFGSVLHRQTLVREFKRRRDDVLSGQSVQNVSRGDERRDVDVDR